MFPRNITLFRIWGIILLMLPSSITLFRIISCGIIEEAYPTSIWDSIHCLPVTFFLKQKIACGCEHEKARSIAFTTVYSNIKRWPDIQELLPSVLLTKWAFHQFSSRGIRILFVLRPVWSGKNRIIYQEIDDRAIHDRPSCKVLSQLIFQQAQGFW